MKQHVTYYVSRVKMKPETKQRLSTVMTVAKTTFRWGFIPLVLYLGNISYGPSFFSCDLEEFKIRKFITMQTDDSYQLSSYLQNGSRHLI